MAEAGDVQPFAPAFRIERLPDGARDVLFALLTRPEAARACCVSRAWNRALCTAARHLWAELDFAAPFFPARVTREVVRGACAKARDALRAVTLPCAYFSALLPALATAHPHLARVVVRSGYHSGLPPSHYISVQGMV